VVGGTHAYPTRPLPMTIDEPKIGDPLFTHAFLSRDQKFSDEKYQGISTSSFDGLMAIPDLSLTYELSFQSRVGFGHLTEIFKEARDRVLLPFPCFQSDLPLYGANSGGPVFDKKGRICGINCTSFVGESISFHIPLKAILELGARDIEFIPEDPFRGGEPSLNWDWQNGFRFTRRLSEYFLLADNVLYSSSTTQYWI
jgi:hypothetical protein